MIASIGEGNPVIRGALRLSNQTAPTSFFAELVLATSQNG